MMVVSIYPLWDSQEIGNKYCKTYDKKICKKRSSHAVWELFVCQKLFSKIYFEQFFNAVVVVVVDCL